MGNTPSLKYQAHERLKEYACLGRSKHADKVEAGKQYDMLCQQGKQGDWTRREYLNRATRQRIYSINSFKTYEKHINYFLNYCKQTYPGAERRTLEQCREYVPEWLEMRIDQGLSAFTIKTEAAALGKLYACPIGDFGVDFPVRHREDITRSRYPAERDHGFSLTKNAEIIEFVRSTGLRRSELENLKGGQLNFDHNLDMYLTVKGKGGKVRKVPVIGNNQLVLRKMMETKQGCKVWNKVPSCMDVHSYRGEYAKAIYNANARDDIPVDERYCCRGDMKGRHFDKKAMRIASNALGHNRIDVIAEHYLY